MDIMELLQQGLTIMVLGMGTVFAFLALLVVSVTQMSRLAQWLDQRFPPETEPAASPSPAATADPNEEILAVIGAAIHRYRANRN